MSTLALLLFRLGLVDASSELDPVNRDALVATVPKAAPTVRATLVSTSSPFGSRLAIIPLANGYERSLSVLVLRWTGDDQLRARPLRYAR